MKDAIMQAVDYCDKWEIPIQRELFHAIVKAVKTYDYFLRALNDDVLSLSRDEISKDEFIDGMAVLLDQQLRRAWNEGMRANGLDPLTDLLPEWEQELQNIIAKQYGFVDQFAADIASGQYSLSQLQARAAMWANNYNETVTDATLATADGKNRLIWVMGETEEHCGTCASLNGIVAFAKEWDALGVKPQNKPNKKLECGGWRCQCELKPTDKRRSPKAIDAIITATLK